MVSYVTKGEEIDGETKGGREREREERERTKTHTKKTTHTHTSTRAGSREYCTDKKTD